MKKTIYLSVIISLMIISCNQKKESPIEGSWQLVYGHWTGMEVTFPDNATGRDVKMWTEDGFVFAGILQMDSVIMKNFGWGKYKFIEGGKYEENVLFHSGDESLSGTIIKMLMDVRNDTLIQRWPVDENWKLKEEYNIEKYVRLK